jgi:serine-type D-Ala-D-Ala carboxypeptidase (penicillin-binding protein 5/6)
VERFVEQMNVQAKRLGLTQTNFKNVTGLPAAGHVTSANDLVRLSVALINDFPEYYSIYSQKEFSYNNITQPNRNLLLFRDPSVDGLKTGHTESAGFCLVATAKKTGPTGERRLLSVMLGTSSENARAQESQKLLNWGYANFDAVKLFERETAVETPRLWKGTQNTIKLGAVEPLFVSVPKGSAARLKTSVVRSDPLLAPLSKGDKAGVLKITLDGQAIAQQPLVALETVPAASLIGRAWDGLRLWLK